MHLKSHLSQKICPVCQRPFSWRRKWKQNWEGVVYCSRRCQGERKKNPATTKKQP